MTWDIPEQDLDHSSECLPELARSIENDGFVWTEMVEIARRLFDARAGPAWADYGSAQAKLQSRSS